MIAGFSRPAGRRADYSCGWLELHFWRGRCAARGTRAVATRKREEIRAFAVPSLARMPHGPPAMTRLPRWLPLCSRRESVHFATWRISSWQTALSESERDVVALELRQRKDQGCELLAFVVMDDHVHVVVRCEDRQVDRLLESWKSFSAHRLREASGRSGAVWQRDTFHRLVRDESDLRARTHYIAANPWKRWPFVGRYPWVWEADGRARPAAKRPLKIIGSPDAVVREKSLVHRSATNFVHHRKSPRGFWL